jgi:hypothetical protein
MNPPLASGFCLRQVSLFFFGCQVGEIDRIKKAFLLIRKALRSYLGFALFIQRANAFLRQGGGADASYQVVGNSGQN